MSLVLYFIAAIGFGIVAVINLTAVFFRDRFGFQDIKRWHLAVSAILFAALSFASLISVSASS